MNGWMLATLGFLALAFVFSVWLGQNADNDQQSVEDYSRRRIKAELNDIELHRPDHIIKEADDGRPD